MLRRELAGCLLCGYEPAAPEVVITPGYWGELLPELKKKRREKRMKKAKTQHEIFPADASGKGSCCVFVLIKK